MTGPNQQTGIRARLGLSGRSSAKSEPAPGGSAQAGSDLGQRQVGTERPAPTGQPDPGQSTPGANGTAQNRPDANGGGTGPGQLPAAGAGDDVSRGGTGETLVEPAVAPLMVVVEVPARRWPKGPDPAKPCPTGDKVAAELWRARRSVLAAEERLEKAKSDVSESHAKERTAAEAHARRLREKGEREAMKTIRQEGMDATTLAALAAIAKGQGVTVAELVVKLKTPAS